MCRSSRATPYTFPKGLGSGSPSINPPTIPTDPCRDSLCGNTVKTETVNDWKLSENMALPLLILACLAYGDSTAATLIRDRRKRIVGQTNSCRKSRKGQSYKINISSGCEIGTVQHTGDSSPSSTLSAVVSQYGVWAAVVIRKGLESLLRLLHSPRHVHEFVEWVVPCGPCDGGDSARGNPEPSASGFYAGAGSRPEGRRWPRPRR